MDFVHPELGKEVAAISGYYTFLRELKLEHGGREVLCIIGMCAVESSCCGSTSFYYATVPGYILSWKTGKTGAGLPVSEVEPIKEVEVKNQLAPAICDAGGVLRQNIEFW